MGEAMIPEDWDRRFTAVWGELNRLLARSAAATAVLLDTSGGALTYAGEDPDFDLALFSSLAAGDYLATREMARLLHEEGMRWVVHQGDRGGMVLAPLHPALLLAVLFDRRSTLGLVRHEVHKARARLEEATRPLLPLLAQRADEEPTAAADDAAGKVIDEGLSRLFGPPA
jgi:predicted regulator of Ras-like GTPase activity (Roadblock/LC7/MglB family)